MRKFFTLAVLLLAVFCGKAQNVQLHYDFGGALYDKDLDGRPALTSTVEMFKLQEQRGRFGLLGDCPRTEFLATAFFHPRRV